MKRLIRPGLIILFLMLDFYCLKSQVEDTFIKSLKEKLSSYTRSVPFEDIYLHSDRDTYIAGEYFWFNAYLFNRQGLSLSAESSYAYVELLNPDNQPVSQTKVRLDNGSGGGGFWLPDSLNTGEYTLRAYTSWMKNFLPNGCFMKIVTVYNPFSETIFKEIVPRNFPEKSEKDILFFPEGGRLLNGFVNKVGVRVFCTGNTRPDFKGYLSDGINDSVAKVFIDSSGIGSFEFFAEQGKEYKLVSNDRKITFFLPVISLTGLSLNVKHEPDNTLKLTINSEGVYGAGINCFYVVIRSGGSIVYGRRVNYSEKSTVLSISENTLNQGINQITIFDATGNPVCNRLVFKPDQKSESIKMRTSDKYGKREKINLEIVLDSNTVSKNDLSDFSLSVSSVYGTKPSGNINDYLITGDEYMADSGNIYNHTDFSKMSPETIDNYLLSLKSIWIKWEDVLSGKFPEIKYPAEKGRQFLSGFYKSRSKTEVNNSKILFLSKPGKIPVFKYAETDKENRFEFSIRDKESSNEYIIQPSVADNSYSIEIESPFSQKFPESGYVINSTKKKIPDAVVRLSINYQVEKIYKISNIGDTIKTISLSFQPVRFYGKPDQELILSDYISLPVMQEVFFELVPWVQVKTRKSKFGFFIQDPVTNYFYDTSPALLVDGVIIYDPSAILNLDPELVEKIDIIICEYVVGDVIFSGIISVITKAGDFSNIPLPASAIRIRNSAYDFARRYKSPDYSTVLNKADRTPDFRNTLYLKHDLKPDSRGRINVEFVTSDFASDFDINLQGASGGNLFSFRKTIRVE